MKLLKILLSLTAGLCFASSQANAAKIGPWDVDILQKTPTATWGNEKGLVRSVYYEGEPFKGKPTKIFAYYGMPKGEGPFPGVVLVHGGGGTAFAEWAQHWAEHGYVALAMDLTGKSPTGKLSDGGPDMTDDVIFRDYTPNETSDMWSYQAVAAVIRGHSLLLSMPEVDKKRTAITGISWGGYTTCIVAGLDHRFKAAVPVYGCGFLDEDSFWKEPRFDKMKDGMRKQWVEDFDPSRYLGKVQCPMLFLDGTNDFAYPMDSLQKSYNLVSAPVTLAIEINRRHGHYWTFKEVDAFIDNHIDGGKALPQLSAMKILGTTVTANLKSPTNVTQAELDYTTDSGPWVKRTWKKVAAEVNGTGIHAELPKERPIVFFLKVTDERGLSVSCPHLTLLK